MTGPLPQPCPGHVHACTVLRVPPTPHTSTLSTLPHLAKKMFRPDTKLPRTCCVPRPMMMPLAPPTASSGCRFRPRWPASHAMVPTMINRFARLRGRGSGCRGKGVSVGRGMCGVLRVRGEVLRMGTVACWEGTAHDTSMLLRALQHLMDCEINDFNSSSSPTLHSSRYKAVPPCPRCPCPLALTLQQV